MAVAGSSVSDLASALSANVVRNPENWTKIIKQFERYPPGDAGQRKLRQMLTQFKAEPDDFSKITNALVP